MRSKLILSLIDEVPEAGVAAKVAVRIENILSVQPDISDFELAAEFYMERGIDARPGNRVKDVGEKSKRLLELEADVALFEERKRLYGDDYRLERMGQGW